SQGWRCAYVQDVRYSVRSQGWQCAYVQDVRTDISSRQHLHFRHPWRSYSTKSLRPTWMWEGTIPRKETVESSLEQRPRVTQDAYMEVSGRTTQETKSISYREGGARMYRMYGQI
ncbi:MAG: hypothetical protein GQ572_02280, partial [Gammaproteobacteria bacterium]|nr:hypothetical protein [Gammaproteobacteria bacterium]